MITSISTNFGVNPISFKCYDSAKIVVLHVMFTLDTANEEYLAAEQLEITFPDQFSASQPANQTLPSLFARKMTCRAALSSRHSFKVTSSSLKNCPSMTE